MTTKTKRKPRHTGAEDFWTSTFTNPSGETVWRVSGTKKDGTRVRQNFKTEVEAVRSKGDLEREDMNIPIVPMMPTRLSREQLDEAERAFADLKQGTLTGAVRFFNENFQDPLKPEKLSVAVERFRAAKACEKLRPDTIKNLRFRLGAFVTYMPNSKLVSEISAGQIEAFLHRATGKARGKRTIKNDRLALSNFFNWAKREKHCVENPMLTVTKVRAGSKRPEVFDLATVRRLLEAALQHEGGKCVPYFVLGLFCGLRPTEIERLSWDKIDLQDKLINIDENTAKVTEDEHCNERYVAVSDNAVAWLLPYSIERGPFAIERKDFDAIKKLAGITTWPQDVLRHTAISNYQAEHRHEGLTAEWAGNSVKVVRKHYKRSIKPADAKLFWAISPEPSEGKILKLKAA